MNNKRHFNPSVWAIVLLTVAIGTLLVGVILPMSAASQTLSNAATEVNTLTSVPNATATSKPVVMIAHGTCPDNDKFMDMFGKTGFDIRVVNWSFGDTLCIPKWELFKKYLTNGETDPEKIKNSQNFKDYVGKLAYVAYKEGGMSQSYDLVSALTNALIADLTAKQPADNGTGKQHGYLHFPTEEVVKALKTKIDYTKLTAASSSQPVKSIPMTQDLASSEIQTGCDAISDSLHLQDCIAVVSNNYNSLASDNKGPVELSQLLGDFRVKPVTVAKTAVVLMSTPTSALKMTFVEPSVTPLPEVTQIANYPQVIATEQAYIQIYEGYHCQRVVNLDANNLSTMDKEVWDNSKILQLEKSSYEWRGFGARMDVMLNGGTYQIYTVCGPLLYLPNMSNMDGQGLDCSQCSIARKTPPEGIQVTADLVNVGGGTYYYQYKGVWYGPAIPQGGVPVPTATYPPPFTPQPQSNQITIEKAISLNPGFYESWDAVDPNATVSSAHPVIQMTSGLGTYYVDFGKYAGLMGTGHSVKITNCKPLSNTVKSVVLITNTQLNVSWCAFPGK